MVHDVLRLSELTQPHQERLCPPLFTRHRRYPRVGCPVPRLRGLRFADYALRDSMTAGRCDSRCSLTEGAT